MSKMGSIFLSIQELYYQGLSESTIVSKICDEFGVSESFVVATIRDMENAA